MKIKELENSIKDLGLILDGCVYESLYTEFGKKFCWETNEKFECMVDEITRLKRVIDFYDVLCEIKSENLLSVINEDSESLEDILTDFLEYYLNVPLSIKLDKNRIIKEYIKEKEK